MEKLQIKLRNRHLDVEVTDDIYTFEVYDNEHKVTGLLLDLNLGLDIVELIEYELQKQSNEEKEL